jgi:hypothetical protein
MAGVLVEGAELMVSCVDALRFSGLAVDDDGDVPAGVAST